MSIYMPGDGLFSLEVPNEKSGINFSHYEKRLVGTGDDEEKLKKLLEELIDLAKELPPKQSGKIDIAYYETVLSTQNQPEILQSEITDLLQEFRER